MVFLATVATVIASQAVISGAFSVVHQAGRLGYLPRLRIQYTSEEMMGQIYVPWVNWLLLAAVLTLVLAFRTAAALAFAYGTAVTGTITITTLLFFYYARHQWRWPLWAALTLTGAFLSIDVGFFLANLYKVVDGGWVPLAIGTATFVLMWTWSRGSAILLLRTHRDSIPTLDLIKMLEKSKPVRVPGTAVFLTNDPTSAPSSLMRSFAANNAVTRSLRSASLSVSL